METEAAHFLFILPRPALPHRELRVIIMSVLQYFHCAFCDTMQFEGTGSTPVNISHTAHWGRPLIVFDRDMEYMQRKNGWISRCRLPAEGNQPSFYSSKFCAKELGSQRPTVTVTITNSMSAFFYVELKRNQHSEPPQISPSKAPFNSRLYGELYSAEALIWLWWMCLNERC